MPTRNQGMPAAGRGLIIDDTPLDVKALSAILAAEGFEVLTAADGEDGLRLALECKPDVVLLDLVLPGMLGIDVLDMLKREQPETMVILTTAFASEETAIQAMPRGISDYIISKRPFDSDEVREVVRRAHKEAQLRRENVRLQHELATANEQLREYSRSLERTVVELRAVNERLNELDRSRGSFFSMISHELRHPLTVAKGYLELVSATEGALDSETRGYLGIAEQSLGSLAKMLDDLLDLSRMEAGHYQIDRKAERVAALVDQTVLASGAAASSKDIKLSNDLPNTLPLVSADPMRIAQVLANLVDNAIKFTPRQGSISISGLEHPHEVEVIISDTGIGIASSELEKIFERFYQIKNPDVPNNQGAGLGLAISREIVRMHGGQIWATSEVGRGTQIHFTLPKVMESESL